ncbi:hypothetical protein MSG28_000926 [Choristoneura fumiferana]|uniref:Uncharacterized protein n=1 Tax=Choristoneura fumiferana TaxID=7141 RepID=A0ACC0K2Y5_CHOFU|nr:hypothetical protein MSG28_000926 [Choristoneura fumiferana]
MQFITSIILVCIAGCQSAPVDEPIRVDLPVYDQPQASSNVEMVPAESSGVDARSDRTLVANLISHKLHTATNALGQKLSQQHTYGVAGQFDGGYFAAPVTTLEGAFLETEGLGSKKLTIKENLHGIVAGLLQPKPIVDTISEEEKYGNTGDKFYGAGRALVGGAEGVSNLVNSVLEVPGTIFRKITRIATEKLNNLGGKLIGL